MTATRRQGAPPPEPKAPAHLVDAQELAKRLATKTDSMTEKLVAVERHLTRLGLGTTAWLDISGPEDEQNEGTSIGFTKIGGTWKLAVVSGPYSYGEITGDIVPLLKASKHLRLRAAKKIEALVVKLVAEAAKQLEDIEAADAQLDNVLRGLPPLEPEPDAGDFGEYGTPEKYPF